MLWMRRIVCVVHCKVVGSSNHGVYCSRAANLKYNMILKQQPLEAARYKDDKTQKTVHCFPL